MSRSDTSSLHPLVTQTLVDTKKYYCPFLDRGYCRESSRCNFSHDSPTSTKIPTDYCHFYLANQCLYGQDCKFRHSEPSISPTTTTTINNNHIVNQIIGDYVHDDYDDGDEWEEEEEEEEEDDDDDDDDEYGYNDDQRDHHYRPNSSYHNNNHDEEEEGEDEGQEADTLNNDYYEGSSSAPSASRGQIDGFCLFPGLQIGGPNSSTSSASSAAPAAETILHQLASANDSGSTSSTRRGRNRATFHGTTRKPKDYPLCPYSLVENGECPMPDGQCYYLHGQICDLCCRPCLHPYDETQRHQHRDDCLREHEREMELSFAVQRSKDKVCGICMDTVVEKKPITSSRFGILEKCNHIFCLDCIRKWRGTKQFDNRTIRACPECRVSSDFVVPSKYWVEDQDDKEKLIHDYKTALRSKPCRYFDEGKGDCPFAGSCFYKHAYPDGRIAVMEAPKPRRKVYGTRGPSSSMANYFLWNLLTSTDDDDWSNDELESLYYDPDYATEEEEDDDDDTYDADAYDDVIT